MYVYIYIIYIKVGSHTKHRLSNTFRHLFFINLLFTLPLDIYYTYISITHTHTHTHTHTYIYIYVYIYKPRHIACSDFTVARLA